MKVTMSKPIKFELEFSGWQRARIDSDGAVIRPADAKQIAHAIAADMEHRFNDAGKFGTLKVKVKQL
jgi:hypothetical protein